MIKNNTGNFKKLLIIFTFLLIGIVGREFVNKNAQNSDYSFNKSEIESILQKKSIYLDEKLKEIYKNYSENPENAKNWFYSKGKIEFEEKEIGYFLYENNNLKYWTTNDISLPTSATHGFFDKAMINLPNGWYICKYFYEDDFLLVALARIKKEYSYENDIIKNSFTKDLNLNHDAIITTEAVKFSTKIIFDDNNNNFYLSFKPNSQAKLVKFSFYNFLGIFNVLLSLAFVLLLLLFFAKKYSKFSPFLLLALAIAFLFLRYFILKIAYIDDLSVFKLFSPELFAESFWLKSLGDYLINVVFFFTWALVLFFGLKKHINVALPKLYAVLFSLSLSGLLFLSSLFISNLFYGIIWNSSLSFSFDNILSLDIYSFIGVLIILSIVLAFVLIFVRLFIVFRKLLNTWIVIIGIFVLYTIYLINFVPENLSFNDAFSFSLLFFISWSVLAFIYIKNKENYFFIVALLILFSFLVSVHFSRLSDKKELDTFKVLTYNLAAERDVGAEFFIKEAYEELMTDAKLAEALSANKLFDVKSIVNNVFLNKRYFNKYEIQTTVCEQLDSLFIEPEMLSVDCFEFFREQIFEYGISIPATNFYFLDNHNGRISYLGEISTKINDTITINIYVELNSKIFSEGLGYPEMLLDKKLLVKKTARNYNYAKYNKSRLISSKGDYKYQFTINNADNDTAEYSLYKQDSYIHFKYKPDADNVIILSKSYSQYSKQLVSFTYIFIFIFIFFNFVWLFAKMKNTFFKNNFNLKVKIQFWFITILISSLLLTGTIAMLFIIQGYKQKQKETMLDKMHSVIVELEQNVGQKNKINYEDFHYLNNLLVKLSNVFYTDINLYDLNGILISSSRSELFDKGLKARYIDANAYSELILKNPGTVIVDERIDEIYYMSLYIPFRNVNNEIVAYLNLPYFARQNEFAEEISNFVLAFSNIFLILILVAVIVGVFISRQLTRPLALVQEKIRLMDINKKAEKIIYNKNDELGGLIREYNRKVDELSESANKLAQSERETAWREMAKQIAHEIKNPLTPMKLSVQYLERAYDLKDENWEATYRKVSKTLIEQIDILSAIASEFSNFAKMPASKKEIINISEIILNSIQLFENAEEISFKFENNIKTKGLIFADKEQILRVFTNLIKNSTQAIPKDREGVVKIIINELEKNYIIKVVDNGTGIPEQMLPKIFQPNFTTKSGGMGLGLSMVKSLLISNNATIYFETHENIGTEFIIEIPIFEENNGA